MKLAIFGSGYVGLVTAACFANAGNEVICVDVDAEKIERLKKGVVSIFEPGLSELILENMKLARIQFTTDAISAVKYADIIFLAVGTPSKADGSADLQAVFDVVKKITQNLDSKKTIVIKSTIPVGTSDQIKEMIDNKNADIVFNPEFLKQGNAVHDCMKPDRIIIGSDSEDTILIMKKLYKPFYTDKKQFLVMNRRSAEMAKYAANAMLATKISFINEMSQIADRIGADIHSVRDAIAFDPRIGPHFINPGMGYGGSCFPKDVKALQNTAKNVGYHARILHAIEEVNRDQKLFLFDKILRYYQGNLKNKTFAIWGLAFKPNTDDIRDASSITLIQKLLKQGARIQAYDPKAMHNFKKFLGNDDRYGLFDNADSALENANALCIATEWSEFKSPDFKILQEKLTDKVVFDGRGVLCRKNCDRHNIAYYGI